MLLQLEYCLYAVRNEESRDVLVSGWNTSLDQAALAVARHRGRDVPCTEDRQDAFAMIATTLLGAVVSGADDDPDTSLLVAGAYRRIRDASVEDA